MTEKTSRISLLLVEDHRVTLEGLQSWIGKSEQFELLGATDDARTAIDMATKLNPDVILLDLHLPGGLSVKETLAALSKLPSRIVVFSADVRQHLIKRVLDSGAQAFVSKNETYET